MTRKLAMFAAVALALTVTAQTADAGPRRHVDPRLAAVSIGVGAASTAAFFSLNDWHWKWDSARHGISAAGAYALTTVGCAAVSPMVATAVLNRPLTYREAHVLIGSCVVPIVGGLLVNAAYDANPQWEAATAPRKVFKKKKQAKK